MRNKWRQAGERASFGSTGAGARESRERAAIRDLCRHHGFTLIELIVVMSIIMILIAIAAPIYKDSVTHAKEAVLQDDLFTLRHVIEQYTMDKRKAPQSLDDLVTARYLGALPKDPFTKSNTTWVVEMEDYLTAVDPSSPGIANVKSGSDQTALDGTTYNAW